MSNEQLAQYIRANFHKVSTDGNVRFIMEELYTDTFGRAWKADCAACIQKGFNELMNFYKIAI